MKKSGVRICRYPGCNHPNKEINLDKDEYVVPSKGQYYHKDCFENKKKGGCTDAKTKNDLQYIKNKWTMNIDRNVSFSLLFKVLNELVSEGFPSEYLVFVIDKIISDKSYIRSPIGFKKYAHNEEMKTSYRAKQFRDMRPKEKPKIVDSDDAPKFNANNRTNGFGRIIGGGQ